MGGLERREPVRAGSASLCSTEVFGGVALVSSRLPLLVLLFRLVSHTTLLLLC